MELIEEAYRNSIQYLVTSLQLGISKWEDLDAVVRKCYGTFLNQLLKEGYLCGFSCAGGVSKLKDQ